ncbi:hypothetical protein CBR_g34755 [Chara braunii]|uniref:cysteine-S-conjugate beta-lyase n=1 Tax=Chara braunii TaxID=69332 RepID=A0A388LJ76_CHABU|nr:hypothetical protein CBR_g34755 [Chara braunii]|eukprot:GBG82380.1 hypothetical protein CBR_g34755 [Chara braunii]
MAEPCANGAKATDSKYDHHGLAFATCALHFQDENDPYGAKNAPIYMTATFKLPSATKVGSFLYSRFGNPTRSTLEKHIARLHDADRAFCFSTGMAALTTVMQMVEVGDEIVADDDLCGGTDRLLTSLVTRWGVAMKRANTSHLDEVRAAVTRRTKLVFLEIATNPLLQITDVAAISEIAHRSGALVVVDNSFMSSALSRPLDHGADIVMESLTKFMSGHSDAMGGFLAVRGEQLAKDIHFLLASEGACLSPFDSFLILRGMQTLSLRVEKAQENAQAIAEWLVKHPLAKKVFYLGLPGFPDRDLHFKQCSGAGSVLCFTTGDVELSKLVADGAEVFQKTVSFGSVGSLITLPCFMSHAAVPKAVREARGLPDDLVRLAVGIEFVGDLINDLDRSFKLAMAKLGGKEAPKYEPTAPTPYVYKPRFQ